MFTLEQDVNIIILPLYYVYNVLFKYLENHLSRKWSSIKIDFYQTENLIIFFNGGMLDEKIV